MKIPALLVLSTAAVALFGCAAASVVPVPKTGPHIGEEPALVPYPAPPARVEVVGKAPSTMKDAVWIDGEWLWKGRRWIWQGGHWDLPLPGGYYAPPVTVRLGDGALAHYEGGWKAGPRKE
jgi:hypothetical protein